VLHWSAQESDVPETLIKLLLDHGKAIGRPLNIDAPDKTGTTPLMHAARDCCSGFVQALLAAGADVTAADVQGRTALHHVGQDCAGLGSEQQMYQLLISAGGDVFALDNNHQTPLQLAFRVNNDSGFVRWIHEQVAQAPKFRAELASISSNLQTLITGAAAEMRRLDRARTEQQQAAAELEQQREQLQQGEVECGKRERELRLRQRRG